MKTIILAGGFGTRISEETENKPKPMVELNGKPILWHLMNIFASQGFNDFLIATGYKSEVVDSWVENTNFNWNVETLNTGLNTMTGGRVKSCLDYVGEELCFLTYGDGLANVNLVDLLNFHKQQNRLLTMTAVRPPARFGVVEFENGLVTHFGEKSQADGGWINGGFMVVNKFISDYINSPEVSLESEVMPKLVTEKQLSAFQHLGFWQPMDTLREKNLLEEIAKQKTPNWLK